MNSLNSRTSRSVRAVRITIAQREDAERITTVINSAFRRVEAFFVDCDRVDVGTVLNYLSSGKFLLAESEDTLLGCVYVEPRRPDGDHSIDCGPDITLAQSQDHAYLGLLAVDPAHQRSGLGSTLMDAAEDYCRGLGVGFMDIKVVSIREELFGFYRSRGYVETGTSSFPAEVKTNLPCHFIDMSKPFNED